METASLTLVIIGGYAFARNFRPTHYSIRLSAGYHLFYQSAFWGYFWFQVSMLLLVLFRVEINILDVPGFWWSPIDNHAVAATRSLFAASFPSEASQIVIPSILAFWLGLFGWFPLNALVNLFKPADKLSHELAERYGADIEKLIHRAQESLRYLMFTLNNNKVYVGGVFETPDLGVDNSDPGAGVFILVRKSGYRSETHKVHFTTDYKWLDDEDGISIEEVVTFIPLRNIVVATYYRPDLDEKFELFGAIQSRPKISKRFRRSLHKRDAD